MNITQCALFILRELLKADQARLQQSSLVAQQTAVNHQQMLEQTIERLQEELSCALREEENMRKERDQINSEVSYLCLQ